MRISEAKTLLFDKVVALNIACACSISGSLTEPVIHLYLNSEDDRLSVAKYILRYNPHFQGHPVEIIVTPHQGRRAKQ